jgi:hypothetical protein
LRPRRTDVEPVASPPSRENHRRLRDLDLLAAALMIDLYRRIAAGVGRAAYGVAHEDHAITGVDRAEPGCGEIRGESRVVRERIEDS